MEKDWNAREIIDLEYCLGLDLELSQQELHRRDREISMAMPAGLNSRDDRHLLRWWLDQRRKTLFDAQHRPSPGKWVEDIFRMVSAVLLAVGLSMGLGAGLSFFSYSGSTPVNVFHFLFLFVFSQLATLLLLILGATLRSLGWRSLPSPIVWLYGGLLRSSMTFIASWQSRVGREQKERVEFWAGMAGKLGASYRMALFWPFVALSQSVLVAINLGLLAASLFRIATSDIAFGWQSTLQLTGPAISRFVQLIALPWSWMIGPSSYPSLQEIEGSRIILKDGILHLATPDLVSWWPFLLLSLLTYGLLLRLILAAVASRVQHRVISRQLPIGRPDVLLLLQRMKTVILHTAGDRIEDREDEAAPTAAVAQPGSATRPNLSGVACLLLMPSDVTGLSSSDAIVSAIADSGLHVLGREEVQLDSQADRSLFERLTSRPLPGGQGIFLVLEAWMPPINETLVFIKALRASIGASTPVFIGLIGRQKGDRPPEPPGNQDSSLWRRKLGTLGDPNLLVLELFAANRGQQPDAGAIATSVDKDVSPEG